MISTAVAAAATHWAGPGFGASGFGFGVLGFVFPFIGFILFLLSIGLIFRVVRRAAFRNGGAAFGAGFGQGFGRYHWASGAHAAEVTLAERFAQGDIDEKEYRARLEVLRANTPVRPMH